MAAPDEYGCARRAVVGVLGQIRRRLASAPDAVEDAVEHRPDGWPEVEDAQRRERGP
jgi:hypothetical protein